MVLVTKAGINCRNHAPIDISVLGYSLQLNDDIQCFTASARDGQQAGWPVYRTAPYKLIDRLNTVNMLLCNAQGRRRLLVRPSCTNLIKALDGCTYKEDTKIVDRSSGLDHVTDALGHLVMGVFSNDWAEALDLYQSPVGGSIAFRTERRY